GNVSAATSPEEFDLNPKTVLMKGAHDPEFFISWHSQKDVVRTLAWKSTLMIWGGPLVTLVCVYILALQLDWLYSVCGAGTLPADAQISRYARGHGQHHPPGI